MDEIHDAEIVRDEGAATPPPSTALARREPVDVFSRFDNLDDEAIVAELEGRLVDSAVYHFRQDGKELWGLSKVGADWAVTELGRKGYIMRDEKLEYVLDPTDPSYVLFTAQVGKYYVGKSGDEAQGEAAIGTKRQWTKMKRRDDSIVSDPFWFEKGSQKAIRNARLRLIPEETKAAIISVAKDKGRVKEVTTAEAQYPSDQRQAPPSSPAPGPAQKVPILIRIQKSDGKYYNEPLAEVYANLKKMRSLIGDEKYYEKLSAYKCSHANELPHAKLPDFYADVLKVMSGGALKLSAVGPKK